jgi:hypothetical protein
MTTLAGLSALLVVIALFFYAAWKSGRTSHIAEDEEKKNDAVEKALSARDRLLRDPDFADRVRRRFSR